MKLQTAQRKRARIKMALQAPSGGGKTYSALQISYGLCGDWSKIAVIDTENHSAELYAHLGEFKVVNLVAPFSPERYISALELCEKAGMEVVIIDSITHEWENLLEFHGSMAGNSYTNWNKITPRHNAFVQHVLQSPVHTICTMRTKQDYVLNEKNGRMVPEKVGLKSVQRDGLEYEFTLVFSLMEDSSRTGLGYRSLQLPLSNWISPKVLDRLPNGKKVTLGQCMKHETGFPDVIDQNTFYLAVLNNPNRKWKAVELLEYVYDLAPEFNPGDTVVYSNTNTILVSMVIEAATGQNHSKLLHERILSPLGMIHTFYQPHDPLPAVTAQGYFDLYNNHTLVNVSNLVTGSGNGYGGIFSNVFDLYTFIDHLLVQKDLLTPQSLSLMQTFGKQDPPNQYGYGIMKKFIVRGVNAGYGHSGRDLGYTANLFYFPSRQVTHVFFINYGTDGDSDLKEVFLAFQEDLLDITLQ